MLTSLLFFNIFFFFFLNSSQLGFAPSTEEIHTRTIISFFGRAGNGPKRGGTMSVKYVSNYYYPAVLSDDDRQT